MPRHLKLFSSLSKIWLACNLMLALPNFAFAVNEKNTLDLKTVMASADSVKDQFAYQAFMAELMRLVHTQHLAKLWQEAQKNPEAHRGALNLAQFFRDLDQCQLFETANQNVTLQADPARRSDFYVLGGKAGFFNHEAFEKGTPEGIVALGIHVCAGAAGYQDQDYQLSLALLMDEASLDPNKKEAFRGVEMEKLYPQTPESLYRRSPQDLKLEKEERETPKDLGRLRPETKEGSEPTSGRQQKLIIQKKGGSFTGVGGGGDVFSVMVKMEMLTYMNLVTEKFELPPSCKSRWKDRTVFVADVLNLKMESKDGLKNIVTSKDGGDSMLIPTVPGKYKDMHHLFAQLAVFYLCNLKADAP